MLPLIFLWLLMILSVFAFVNTKSELAQIIPLIPLTLGSVELFVEARLDSLSTMVTMMVALLGLSNALYARRYLRGEKRFNYFYRYLTLTVLTVTGFILSNNLLILFFMWAFTAYCLYKLLLFYPDRIKAQKAAKKQAIIYFMSSSCLLVAIVFIYLTFNTFDLSQILSLKPEQLVGKGLQVNFIGVFLVLSAMGMSAQLPFHFWLPETMETPAVVSALMHAGIINAGGFLLIRLSPLLEQSQIAMIILTSIGCLTAVYAALVMATQNTIKQKLAYSTISQMGLMMFLIGLGAFSLALYHLIAHSIYKAHAFLATGSLISESKKAHIKWHTPSKTSALAAINAGFLVIVVGVVASSGKYLPVFTYAAILLLSFSHNSFRTRHIPRSNQILGMTCNIFLVAASIAVYLLIESTLASYLQHTLPSFKPLDQSNYWKVPLATLSFSLFSCGFWLTIQLKNPKSSFLKKLYFRLWNGNYHSASY